MKELLRDFGEVKTSREVSGEVRSIDLLVSPHPDRLDSLQALGLLGRILSQSACPIEFFRNAVPAAEIANCRDKGADLRSEFRRLAEQEDKKVRVDSPILWIFTPTLSEKMQKIFQMRSRPRWEEGIYFLPENDWTAIVAIHQLPVSIDTLWMRLLGRDAVQAKAVQELLDLPKDHAYRRTTLHHLAILQVNLGIGQNRRSKDLQEVMMNLMPAYEKWEAEKLAEGQKLGEKLGEKRGKQRGQKLGEKLKGIEIARRMLAKNMPIAEIADLTGLTIAQVEDAIPVTQALQEP